jgi:GNAT superfamily N-acetyltransferase
MNVVKAEPIDAEHLTDLTFRSKAFWGYDPLQMEQWRDELSVSREYLEKNQAYKLMVRGRLEGFYAFVAEGDHKIKLDFLFIEPRSIGLGYGSILLADLVRRSQLRVPVSVKVEADPNAVGFYLSKGFKTIGQKRTAIRDRYLPIMELIVEGN